LLLLLLLLLLQLLLLAGLIWRIGVQCGVNTGRWRLPAWAWPQEALLVAVEGVQCLPLASRRPSSCCSSCPFGMLCCACWV
jgi:hypothetical protein